MLISNMVLIIIDEVYAAVPYYACGVASEVALVPSEWVAKKPSKLTFEAAAALPHSASLAWNAIVLQASLNRENTSGKRSVAKVKLVYNVETGYSFWNNYKFCSTLHLNDLLWIAYKLIRYLQ